MLCCQQLYSRRMACIHHPLRWTAGEEYIYKPFASSPLLLSPSLHPSIPPPSPLSHLPVSLIPYLLEHFPPSLHANTWTHWVCTKTCTQTYKYRVAWCRLWLHIWTVEGNKALSFPPVQLLSWWPTLICCCHACNKHSIQRCSSKCTAHAFIFEMFCFCTNKTYIIIKKIMLHIKNRKVDSVSANIKLNTGVLCCPAVSNHRSCGGERVQWTSVTAAH